MTDTERKHSPLPFLQDANFRNFILSDTGSTVAIVQLLTREIANANAAFIVTACNSHYDNLAKIDKLAEALEAHASTKAFADEDYVGSEIDTMTNAALSQAKGEA